MLKGHFIAIESHHTNLGALMSLFESNDRSLYDSMWVQAR